MFPVADREANVASSDRGQRLGAARGAGGGDGFHDVLRKQLVALDGKFGEKARLIFEVMGRSAIRDTDGASHLAKRQLAHADLADRGLNRTEGRGAKVAVVVGQAGLRRRRADPSSPRRAGLLSACTS